MIQQWVPFLDAVEDVSRGNQKIPQRDFLPAGDLAIIDQGASPIAGYTNDTSTRVRTEPPVLVFGDHTRVFKYVNHPFAMGADGVKVLRVRNGFDSRFVYRFLASVDLPDAGYSRHYKFLKQVTVPQPSLEEQRRIAAILDQADAIRTHRRQVLTHLDAVPQAVFRSLFGDPSTWHATWPVGTIDDLAESAQYGTSSPAGGVGDWPVLRMGNLTDDARLDLRDLKFMNLPPADVPKYTVQRGDLLFNRTNSKEKVGKACVVHTDEELAFAGYLVRVRFKEHATADFVATYLTSPHGRAVRLRLAKAAVNQANINAKEMRAIKIAHPPLALRQQFAGALATIRDQREQLQAAQARGDELFASLQSRAFGGEL